MDVDDILEYNELHDPDLTYGRWIVGFEFDEVSSRFYGDMDLELTGVGRSLHAIASTADGRLLNVQGAGKIDNSMLTAIAADPLSKLYSALNPFTTTRIALRRTGGAASCTA